MSSDSPLTQRQRDILTLLEGKGVTLWPEVGWDITREDRRMLAVEWLDAQIAAVEAVAKRRRKVAKDSNANSGP